MEIEMIDLAIVSDIRLYREGLGRLLSESGTINVIGVVTSHNELLGLLNKTHLNLVLLDMRMVDSRDVVTSITSLYNKTKIIVIAVPENAENYLLCAESGISGYLTKESSVEELISAIETVGKGDLYCPGSITKNILDSIKHKHDTQAVKEQQHCYSSLLNILTQREAQVVKLIAKGLSNKQIASKLTIEISTVKNHVHNILVKMGVESRTKAACILQETFSIHRTEPLDLDT